MKAKAKKAPAFTPEELKTLQGMAYATFEYIAADAFALEGNGSMSRSGVIELVLDANRMDMFAKTPETKELLTRLYALDYKEMVKAVKPAFPYARYS